MTNDFPSPVSALSRDDLALREHSVSDALPPRLCSWCGFVGRHRAAADCISELRDSLARVEFQRDQAIRARHRTRAPRDPGLDADSFLERRREARRARA